MTILPKKKVQKDKTEAENLDPPPRSPPGESRVHSSRRPGSPPPRWNSPAPIDERLTVTIQDPGGRYEEPSTSHNKRRHRSSPHRTCRKHHRHSERPHHHAQSHTRPAWGEQSQHSQGASTSHASHQRGYRPTATVSSQEHDAESVEESCNSGDEYVAPAVQPPNGKPDPQTLEDYQELERCFEAALKEKKGLIIKKMGEDGACMFRAVADQVYGDQEMHSTVRKLCVDYMAKNADFYRQYVTEDFNTYLNRKRIDHCHGNHVELQALSEIFNRPIEIYQYSTEPINTFHGTYKTDNEPIRLSYHGGVHYNSVCDPYKATIGVGLGLPGLQPGLAEKNLMHDAMQKSEDGILEHTMLQDKLRETDWELTQEAIEEQVARESYIQWLCDQEKRKNMASNSRSASAACSSSASVSSSRWMETVSPHSPDQRKSNRSPRSNPSKSANNSAQNSPMRKEETERVPSPPHPAQIATEVPGGSASPKPSTSQFGAVGGGFPPGFSETDSLMNDFNPTMYGLSDWDEDDIMTQIIAQSQQEYLNNLKKKAQPPSSSPQTALQPPPQANGQSTSQMDGASKSPENCYNSLEIPTSSALSSALLLPFSASSPEMSSSMMQVEEEPNASSISGRSTTNSNLFES